MRTVTGGSAAGFGIVFVAAMMLVAMIMVASAAQAEVKRYDVPDRGSPVIGPDKAAITIIEFIDYQ